METMLIVDDEERIRNIYRRVFQKEGFRVREAAGAGEAYERMTEDPADVLLLDIALPDVDGIVLFDLIRTFHRKARIIITSAFSVDRQRALIQGATDYYDKSDSLQVLVRKVKESIAF